MNLLNLHTVELRPTLNIYQVFSSQSVLLVT